MKKSLDNQMTLEQLKRLVIESKTHKRVLKEEYVNSAESIIQDLVERAIENYEPNRSNINEAVSMAIDEGLIVTADILTLLQHYGSMSDKEIIQSYYDELFNNVYELVSDEIEDMDDEDEDEDIEVEEE